MKENTLMNEFIKTVGIGALILGGIFLIITLFNLMLYVAAIYHFWPLLYIVVFIASAWAIGFLARA